MIRTTQRQIWTPVLDPLLRSTFQRIIRLSGHGRSEAVRLEDSDESTMPRRYLFYTITAGVALAVDQGYSVYIALFQSGRQCIIPNGIGNISGPDKGISACD